MYKITKTQYGIYMATDYATALKRWATQRLIAAYEAPIAAYGGGSISVDESTVTIEMDFDEGNACCGGAIDGCYCSMATSPRAEVVVTAKGEYVNQYGDKTKKLLWRMDASDFDFVVVLGEIVAAGGGTITDEGETA